MLPRIAIDQTQKPEEKVFLTKEQTHYLCRVLRLNKGDRLLIIDDSKNQTWLAELCRDVTNNVPTATAMILEEVEIKNELPINIVLMVALPKGNAFDEVVRQATELGVSSIIPLISERTLLQPSSQKLERWRRIIKEAAEQSERQIIPSILDNNKEGKPLTFAEGLLLIEEIYQENCQKYICEARGDLPLLINCLFSQKNDSRMHAISSPHSIIVAIGPEGGWTLPELKIATNTGFQAVSLGKRILRAVTAPIVALSLVASIWENNL